MANSMSTNNTVLLPNGVSANWTETGDGTGHPPRSSNNSSSNSNSSSSSSSKSSSNRTMRCCATLRWNTGGWEGTGTR